MKFIIFIFVFLFLSNCTSYSNYEDFKERNDSTMIIFQDNAEQCEKLGSVQASRSEGSKRAGEILIDKKRYFMSCMNRKGWTPKVSN